MFGITKKGNTGACVAKVNGLERVFVSKEQQRPPGRHEKYIVYLKTSKPTPKSKRTSGT